MNKWVKMQTLRVYIFRFWNMIKIYMHDIIEVEPLNACSWSCTSFKFVFRTVVDCKFTEVLNVHVR